MRDWDLLRSALPSCAAAALLAGCASAQPPVAMPQSRAFPQAKQSKIEHVVIVVQMGRSFNNLFEGWAGAKTVRYGYDSQGRKIDLKPVSLATTWRLKANAYLACNGIGSIPGTDCRMNGFNEERWTCDKPGNPPCPIKYPPYAYVPRSEIKPYLAMASQYVVGDQMYASNFDASSFGSLQYIVAGQDDNTLGYPSGLPGCGGGPHDWIKTIGDSRTHPCFDSRTLGDELDAARLSWGYYESGGTDGICGNAGDSRDGATSYGMWIAYWAIKHICYGPDWDGDIVSPPQQFLTDVGNGKLRAVSWVTPAYKNSDEAGSGSGSGPSWVASVVNAVGESKYWNSTAIFVFWDSFGGWFDSEPPPYVGAGGLGFRVPLLVISPYAKERYVSHVRYEHGSILKFTEDQFGLERLGAGDTRANSPAPDCFDFNREPRKFVPIKGGLLGG
jgi:phospholipase C